jgi:hypothetical protein
MCDLLGRNAPSRASPVGQSHFPITLKKTPKVSIGSVDWIGLDGRIRSWFRFPLGQIASSLPSIPFPPIGRPVVFSAAGLGVAG